MRTRSLTNVVAFLVMAACVALMVRTQSTPPVAELHTPHIDQPTQVRAQLIGTLRGRDFTLHYFAGERIALDTPTGRVLARDLSPTDFGEQFPDIFRSVESAIADNWDAPRPAAHFPVTLLADSDSLLADSE